MPNSRKQVGKLESIELTGKNIIIATGSKPASLPFIEIDKKRVITSTEALKITKLPKHMIIMGGGVIGLELGSVFARLRHQDHRGGTDEKHYPQLWMVLWVRNYRKY